MGRRIIICPGFLQILAVTPGDVEARRHFGDLEAGRDRDDIRRPQLAVGGDDPVARKMVDVVGDQFDVWFGKCPEPAIVEQDALAIGRIGRHALCDRSGRSFNSEQDEVGEFLAVPVVALIDRAIRMRPSGILAQERQQSVAIPPEHVEAIPLHVERQMREAAIARLRGSGRSSP